jgi:hypothetical protein
LFAGFPQEPRPIFSRSENIPQKRFCGHIGGKQEKARGCKESMFVAHYWIIMSLNVLSV